MSDVESQKLRANLKQQLQRLVEQLAELEGSRQELGEQEYGSLKSSTLEQLQEFSATLDRLVAGDVSLMSELQQMKATLRAAISNAFHTPEVMRMFVRKQPEQLREKLAELDRILLRHQHQNANCDDLNRQKTEVLVALEHLGEKLTAEERRWLEQHSLDGRNGGTGFESVDADDCRVSLAKVLHN